MTLDGTIRKCFEKIEDQKLRNILEDAFSKLIESFKGKYLEANQKKIETLEKKIKDLEKNIKDLEKKIK